MRLTIVHDGNGNITSLVASPADAPPAYLESKATEHVTQIDDPEITDDLEPQAIQERLSDLAENSRIDVDSKANLTRK